MLLLELQLSIYNRTSKWHCTESDYCLNCTQKCVIWISGAWLLETSYTEHIIVYMFDTPFRISPMIILLCSCMVLAWAHVDNNIIVLLLVCAHYNIWLSHIKTLHNKCDSTCYCIIVINFTRWYSKTVCIKSNYLFPSCRVIVIKTCWRTHS